MARAKLLRWFHAGVAAVDARQRVHAVLAPQPVPPRWHLLAVGKAATDMAQGALEAWPTGCAGGVVVAPVGSKLPPTAESVSAGASLLATVGSKLPPTKTDLLCEQACCGSELARDSSTADCLQGLQHGRFTTKRPPLQRALVAVIDTRGLVHMAAMAVLTARVGSCRE